MKRSPPEFSPYFIIGLRLVLAAGAAHTQDLRPEDARLVIRSGFEPDVSFSGTFHGVDNSVSGPNNDWDDMGDVVVHTLIQEVGDIGIVDDPVNPGNKVAKFEIITPNEKKGRAQAGFKCKNPERYDEHYYLFRWYIPADWETLKELDPHRWTNFWEIWTQKIPESECDVYDGAGSFRMNLRILETSATSNTFQWRIGGQNRCYNNETGSRNWERFNDRVEVPFGRWSTVEFLIRKGPDPKTHPDSRARVIIRIQPDGGSWRTLFDIQDERTEHSARPQPGYLKTNPFKVYTHEQNVHHLLDKGLRPYMLYDDIECWLGKAGETPLPVNQAPQLHFARPSDTTGLIAPVDLGVVVEASDSDGAIDNVKLYLDDTLIRRENVSPYTWGTAAPVTDSALLGLVAGTYMLRAQATDDDGATAAVSMTVTVDSEAVKAVCGADSKHLIPTRPPHAVQFFDLTGKRLSAGSFGPGTALDRTSAGGYSGMVIRRISVGHARVKREMIIR